MIYSKKIHERICQIKRFTQFNFYHFEKSNYSNVTIDNLELYLINEKLGNNSFMDKYSKILAKWIDGYTKNYGYYGRESISLIIKEIGIIGAIVTFKKQSSSVTIKNSHLIINIEFPENDNMYTLHDLTVILDHELMHIFINYKGNVTNANYFITNDLLKQVSGKTEAFLMLYYLSFKDEISANIQMFHRVLGDQNLIENDDFREFIKNYPLYQKTEKMINIDVFKYWQAIVAEGNDDILINAFNISDLVSFLTKVSKQIIEGGEDIKRKMSRVFLRN